MKQNKWIRKGGCLLLAAALTASAAAAPVLANETQNTADTVQVAAYASTSGTAGSLS